MVSSGLRPVLCEWAGIIQMHIIQPCPMQHNGMESAQDSDYIMALAYAE